VIESALIETSAAQIAGADVAGCANPYRSIVKQTGSLAVTPNFGRRY
jgi:hypothetical protein